jgi:hypothetical protein
MAVRKILEDLFQETGCATHGTSYRRFQVKHEKSLELIDKLVNIGLISHQNEEYFVSVFGVAEISTVESKKVFDQAEQLYTFLGDRYRADPGKAVLFKEIAKSINLPVVEVAARIRLMTQCSQWAAGWSNPRTDDEYALAQVTPGDGILRFPTFKSCLDQNRKRRNPDDPPIDYGYNFGSVFSAEPASMDFPKAALLAAIPNGQARLLKEVFEGKQRGLLTITSMGLRGLIDMVCVDKVGDAGTFKTKVNALRESGYIGDAQREILLKVIDVGNASSHRGFTPILEDVDLVFAIVTQLLDSIYVHPKAVDELTRRVPKRIP